VSYLKALPFVRGGGGLCYLGGRGFFHKPHLFNKSTFRKAMSGSDECSDSAPEEDNECGPGRANGVGIIGRCLLR
jgi:hypothetical protein